MPDNTVTESRNVIFDETSVGNSHGATQPTPTVPVFTPSSDISDSGGSISDVEVVEPEISEIYQSETNFEENLVPQLRRSDRVKQPKMILSPSLKSGQYHGESVLSSNYANTNVATELPTLMAYKSLISKADASFQAFSSNFNRDVPAIYSDIPGKITDSFALEHVGFQEAMLKELKQLFGNQTLRIVDYEKGSRVIGSIWAHKVKKDQDGKPIKFKSRLNIRGDTMIAGVDYDPNQTSSPTLHLCTLMIFLALVVQYKLQERQYDVTGAYPLAKLASEKPIYMHFPKGMKPIQGKVLQIGNLYGLPQAAYNWYLEIFAFLTRLGFKPLLTDPSCFIKFADNQKDFIMCCVYVDDFRVASTSTLMINDFEEKFMSSYPVTKQTTEWYLGMKIVRDTVNETITITQEAYIDDILTRFGMRDCKPCDTPAVTGVKFSKDDIYINAEDLNFNLSEAVGALLWIARCSHPEIHYIVNQLGSHVRYSSSIKIRACKRVFRYLQGCKNIGVIFRRNRSENFKLNLIAYSDADYAGEPEENDSPMRSTSGSVIFLDGIGPINTKVELQSTTALSTCEAEYYAVGKTAQLVAENREKLAELNFVQSHPTVINEDNQSTIAVVNKATSGSKLRHVKLKHHYIKELIKDKDIVLVYCPTKEMIADILTKALPRDQFLYLRDYLLGIKTF
jgi:hypothetical protein